MPQAMVPGELLGYDLVIASSTPTASVPRTLDRAHLVAGAQGILDARLWCVVEVCLDVPAQVWEPRMLLCQEDADAAVTTAAEWAPDLDVRLGGYTRDTLRRVDAVPAPICHVAGLGGIAHDAGG